MKEVSIDQNIVGTIGSVTDRAGNPAKIDGPWRWLSDSDSVTLEPIGDDAASCRVVTGDVVDDVVNITAEGDADLGEDVVQLLIVVFEPLVIIGGQARFAEGSFSAPEPK